MFLSVNTVHPDFESNCQQERTLIIQWKLYVKIWPVSVLKYSGEVFEWTKEKLQTEQKKYTAFWECFFFSKCQN